MVAALTILSQIAATLLFKVDLGVDLDIALAALGLPPAVYSVARSVLKGMAVKEVAEALNSAEEYSKIEAKKEKALHDGNSN